LRRGEDLNGIIYLFGEAPATKPKIEIGSLNPHDRAEATASTLQKLGRVRNIVYEKHVKKIFVEDGSVLLKPIVLNFPNVDIEVLHVDPRIQRSIQVTRQEIADSIALKEKLLSEFATIREEPPKSKTFDDDPVEQERYAHVLEERMKGLTPADDLFHKLDEATAQLEVDWVDQIHYGFIDPSLVYCGRIHVYPSKEDVMAYGRSGRIPELLRERGYDVEIVFVES
jgi:hypothetical protein